MMEYRIKHVEMMGYFAQAKAGWLRGWKTLGAHPNNQVGEYPEDHTDYPLPDSSDAIKLAHKHAELKKKKKGFTKYYGGMYGSE